MGTAARMTRVRATVGFVQKIKAYSRNYCSWDDYVPVESIVPSKIPNLFCVFNTAEISYRFLCEVLCPTTTSMKFDTSYGLRESVLALSTSIKQQRDDRTFKDALILTFRQK